MINLFGTIALVALFTLPAAAQVLSGQGAGPSKLAPPKSAYVAPVVLADGTAAAGLSGLDTRSSTLHSGGVAWIDFNGDFLADLFVSNGSGYSHWLLRNDGDGTFTDFTASCPKTDLGLEEAAAVFADVDNDGDSDLFVAVDATTLGMTALGGPNLFYLNLDGGFVERAASYGLVDSFGRRHITAGFADYDRDGLVDLYSGRWAIGQFPLDFRDTLYHNLGGSSFTNVASASGTDGEARNNLVFIWLDANLDNWPDLYVGNVGEFAGGYVEPQNHDVFYLNDANGLTFTDATGGGTTIGNDATAAMGMDIGDIDNDGDWDLYITDNPVEGAAPFGNVLYLGDGVGGLADNSCSAAGICLLESSWPCNFADFNRDGWVDLWVGTTFDDVDDALFVNQGDGTFARSPQTPFSANFCRGGSTADFDADGDVDVFLWLTGQDSRLIVNEGVDGNGWLSVKLVGTSSNRDAIGATVRLTAQGTTQMRRVSGGDSAHSQQELVLHFGTGVAQTCSVSVTWPSGVQQSFSGVATSDFVLIDETDGLVTESLVSASCAWERSSSVLHVAARSNFRARTALELEGFGALDWNPDSMRFEASFAGVESDPERVWLRTKRGARFGLDVVTSR